MAMTDGKQSQVLEPPSDGLSEKEQLLVTLKAEEERGMAITKSYHDIWQENLEYFFSQQLAGKARHKDWDWIIVNYIWPTAQQEAAKIIRHRPTFACDPWEPSDADAVEAWQGWLQWMWERGLNDEGMEIEQVKAVMAGKIYGYRVYKLYWEPRYDWDGDQRRWKGEIRGRLWKPSLFWSTGEENINEGSCGTVRYVDLDYALNRWPDYAKQLREEAEKTMDEAEAGGGPHIPGQTYGGGSYPSTGRGGQDKGPSYEGRNKLLEAILKAVGALGRKRDQEDKTQYLRISEQYCRDYATVDKEETQDIPIAELLQTGAAYQDQGDLQFYDTQTKMPLTRDKWPQREPIKWTEPKFPRGRFILRSGDVILNEDEETQKYPFRLWPFVTSPHYAIPFMWQGSDAVQLVKTAQDMINVSVSYLVNHMKQFGDPKIAVERGAIDAPRPRDKRHFKIGSGAGAIIRLVRGGLNRIKILDPPASSPVIYSLYALFSQEFKNIVGLQDIAQGKKTPGDLTATESQYLALSASDRIELQLTMERSWIKRIGLLAAEIAQHHYEPERMVRILGENAIPGVLQITQQLKDVKYDIHVEIGSTLPFDAEKRIARHMQANQLLMGPPSPMLPELLKQLEIPNWRKILERHAIWQQWMQFLQLYQAVREGKIMPEQAVQIIARQAAQTLIGGGGDQSSPNPLPAQGNRETERAPGQGGANVRQ